MPLTNPTQINLSAGTTSSNLSAFTFSNLNGVSFGLNGGVITASVSTAAAGGGITNIKVSAGTLSTLRSDLTFNNSNGVSFGLDTNGLITATVKTDYQSSGAYLTTADLSQNSSKYAGIGFTTTSAGGVVIAGTHDTAGLKLAVPSFLTTAMLSNAVTLSNLKISAGALSALRSDLTFNNSNGVSFGLDTNGILTATVVTNYQSAGAYLTTADLSQNSSKYAGINGAITGGSLTVNTSGVSINLPAYLTTAALSGDSSKYAGLNGAITGGSLTVNTSGISINLPAYLTTADLSQNSSKYAGLNFAGTNISGTLNTSGLSLSVAAPGGGGAFNLQYFEADDVQGMGLMTNITGLNTRPIFVPFILKGNLTNNSLILQVSRSTSGSNAFTLQAGLYTYANATSIGSLGSLSAAFSGSNTGSISGVRYLVATGWGAAATALTPGAYVLVLNFSANGGNTASMNYSLFGGVTASAPVGFIAQGSDQANTSNTTWGPANFWGRYTAGSAALPAGAAQTDILADFTGASQPVAPWFILRP